MVVFEENFTNDEGATIVGAQTLRGASIAPLQWICNRVVIQICLTIALQFFDDKTLIL